MTGLADRTIAVAARKREVVVAVGFEMTRLLPAAHKRSTTVWAGRRVTGAGSLPGNGGAAEGQILEHASPDAIPALI